METMDPNVVFGPIAELIADPAVEEIWINSPDRIFVAKAGRAQNQSSNWLIARLSGVGAA